VANDREENTLKSYRSALKMLKSFNSKIEFGDWSKYYSKKFDLFMVKKGMHKLDTLRRA